MNVFFKDFAGPIATIVAALAAVIVTVIFGLRQAATADAQKEIALDKLKQDVFERRYKVYATARLLLKEVLHQHDFEKIDHNKILEFRMVLDEARFFFGPSIRKFLSEMDAAAESLLQALAAKWQNDARQEPAWSQTMQQLGDATKKLSAIYTQLPEKFETSLRFDQLAKDQDKRRAPRSRE